ncbi:MAG: (Fe-S)-binding protein [Oceanococcus sp.]
MNRQFQIEQADLCVKCGLCAPHCPTYGLDKLEPESPRGRIAIMAGVASGAINNSEAAQRHLDHCLGCQACETVCPAKVPYLEMLDAHRSAYPLAAKTPDRFIRSLVTLDLLRPILRLLLKLVGSLRWPSMRLAHALQLTRLTRLISLAPQHTAWRQPPRRPRPDLQLFVGCMGDLANAKAMAAFLRCCKALDLRVDVIPAQTCCGAIAQHRGDAKSTEKAKQKLATTLRDDLPVVGLDSACVKQLRDQGFVHAQEACGFLNTQDWSDTKLNALEACAVIHQPCSHRNGLGEHGAAQQLLQRIPQLRLQALQQTECCGAAGLHVLDFPERADSLLASKLIEADAADYLVSTNIGCALHFAAGWRRQQLHDNRPPPQTCHPLELISQALI